MKPVGRPEAAVGFPVACGTPIQIMTEKRILIVKPSSLGDVVHTLPVVHAIKRRFPGCHIGWIVQRNFRAVIESDPSVDEIVPIDIPSTSDPLAARGAFLRAAIATSATLRQLRKRFRRAPYDLVLDLHASFRSGLLGLANPGGTRIWFPDAKELNTRFQDLLVELEPHKPHAVDKNLAFAAFLNCTLEPEDFRLVTSPESRRRVREFQAAEGCREGDRVVFCNPAARWSTKLWTVDAWARCADILIDATGARVIFSGGPSDVPHIRAIVERMKRRPVVAAGKLNLAEAAALIEAADVYVGVDSGPMHIAAFVGTPVVALFGPTDPAKVGPYGQGHRVIRKEDLECLACRKRACANRRCLEEINPDTVVKEMVELLGW